MRERGFSIGSRLRWECRLYSRKGGPINLGSDMGERAVFRGEWRSQVCCLGFNFGASGLSDFWGLRRF